MNLPFKQTRNSIALYFTIATGLFLIVITGVTILLVRYEIYRQARQTLEEAMQEVVADYQSGSLEEVEKSFQTQNSYRRDRFGSMLPNVADKEVVTEESIEQNEIGQNDLTKLEDNKSVYSRVILPNGDILFTSDLFESINLDTTETGFQTIETDTICIHAITEQIESGENAGSTVQVGQYCAFPYREQQSLFLKMVGGMCFLLVGAYIFALFVAGKFLKPLEQIVKQTRQFAENCYHELLTPLTTAMTTVDATKRTHTYKDGIQSVEEDLSDMYYSIQTLSKNALAGIQDIVHEDIDLAKLLQAEIQRAENTLGKKRIVLEGENVYMRGDMNAVRIILRNILSNAWKYSRAKTDICITLTKKQLSVQNDITAEDDIDMTQLFHRGYSGKQSQGNGFGLAIVRELCEAHGWEVKGKKSGNTICVIILF
jgi:two-component sensor histidine kinase